MLEFDVDFLDDLFDAWDDCPPPRRMIAAFCGFKPKEKPKVSKNLHELLELFPGGTIR